MATNYSLNKYLTVSGVFFLSVLLSYFHAWGYINIYVGSFLKLTDPTITMLHVNFIFTTLYISQIFFWYTAEMFRDRFNYSGAQFIAMFCLAVKFYINSVSTSYFLYCFGNVIAAMGYCSYDVNSTKLLLEWFPSQVGLAGGLNSAGFSFNVFWSFFGYQVINPNNMPATIEVQEGYRTTRLFDESIAQNVPQFFKLACAVCLVYAIILLFVIKNDPSKYCEEPDKTEIIEQKAIELEPKQENEQDLVPRDNLEDSNLKNINQSLIRELEGFDTEINVIQNSVKFFVYIIIMSYMLGLPLFFNISKKLVGINAQDDLTVTYLSLPTSFLVQFGRLFGAIIMEKVGINTFVVFWLSISSCGIVLYGFFYSNPIVFFIVNSILMLHQGMSYSCKMIFLITIYGDINGKKLMARAMTIMSIFRAFWPIFFDYLMTAIGMEITYSILICANIIIIFQIKRIQ